MEYSFDDFSCDAQKLIADIGATGKEYDYIVAVVRGGSIPATVMSYHLGIPLKSVSWSTYHADQMKESAMDIADDILAGKKVLVVDDILDSGRTMRELIEDWGVDRKDFDLAVLIWNVSQEWEPNFYGRQINRETDEEWITFWWEDLACASKEQK